MKIIISLTIILITIVTEAVKAQSDEPKIENSLLWEISGNGISSPSYLYGTIHMMCEEDFRIKDKVKSAFENSDRLALEIDFDDPSELLYMQQMATSGEPLSKSLSAEAYRDLDKFLKLKLGVGANKFENTGLTTIISTVMLKNLNCSPKMFELEFMTLAAQRDMELIGLEKVEDQDIAFKQSYNNEQFIDQLKFYDTRFFEVLTKVYNDEDLTELYSTLTNKKIMDAKAQLLMLDNRNRNWVKEMPALMDEQAVFFAVGAAHLPGNNGIINLLRESGYTVKPIFK